MYTKEDRMRDYMEGTELFNENKKYLDICITRAIRYISNNYLRNYTKVVSVKLSDIISGLMDSQTEEECKKYYDIHRLLEARCDSGISLRYFNYKLVERLCSYGYCVTINMSRGYIEFVIEE